MHENNSSSNEHEILQNQFTAYISTSIRRERLAYLRRKCDRLNREIMLEEYHLLLTEESDRFDLLLEGDMIMQALKSIREQERYIVMARVIEEKSFLEIAGELGMKYKGVASIYYRTIEKLRRLLGGEDR